MRLRAVCLEIIISCMQEVLQYKHHLEGIVLQEVLGNPELHVARTFPPSDSHLRPRADIARKIHEPPVGKPQIVVHAECKLRLVFAKLGNIEMIYIIMTVEDTRREVRIPDSKRRRHTDIGSTIVGMRHQQPLPFANVVLISSVSKAYVAGCVTAEDGSFVLPYADKNVMLKVSFVGYKSQTLACKPTMHDCVLCQLQSTPYLAPSLVVWVALAVLHFSPRRAYCTLP